MSSTFTAYASLRLQENSSVSQEKLEKQNVGIQILLGVFAGISAIGTVLQALILAKIIG